MSETVLNELKRYMRFDAVDEAALREFGPSAAPHFHRVAEDFYSRLSEHADARQVLGGDEQIARLKNSIAEWMQLLFTGPWDQAYYERRARIGRIHVKIGLPQRFMFGAMNLIRVDFMEVARGVFASDAERLARTTTAIAKVLDIELAIMLETYSEAFVARVQSAERLERENVERTLRAEGRELLSRTHRAEHLASLGQMAAGLAHEIRNPLNAASLQLTLMQRRLGRVGEHEVPAALASAELVASELKRLAELVEQFLQFARPQPLRCTSVDLRATVESVVNLVRPEAEQTGSTLALAPGPGLPAHVDEERIRQVLLNLIRNALQACAPPGGHVTLALTARPDAALLTVTDDGCGIPADAALFQPFFTTKENGTGLGLPIVHRIVTQHGGDVEVESRPGRTVFSVSLPLDPSQQKLRTA